MKLPSTFIFRELPILAAVISIFGIDYLDSGDNSYRVVLYAIAISLALALMSHVTRKVLFPYIVMEELAKTAMKTSQGAAVIFASVCAVVITLILASVSLLR